jgi:hypothetical protein
MEFYTLLHVLELCLRALCITGTGQCHFSIAPAIYHFLIFNISFANLKNYGILKLHRAYSSPKIFRMDLELSYKIKNRNRKI